MRQVIVIGAGISGLTAALKLKELSSAYEVVVLEKRTRLGGLITSRQHEEFWFDSGCYLFNEGHALYQKFPHLFETIERYKCVVWLKGRFFDFPFKIKELLRSVSVAKRLQFMISVVIGNLQMKRKHATADRWLASRVGAAIMNYTHLDTYLKKLQTLPAEAISSYLCMSRLKCLNKSILTILKQKLKQQKGCPCKLKYPTGGVQSIVDAMEEQCNTRGVTIIRNVEITGIAYENGLYRTSTDRGDFGSDALISTIPLNCFVPLVTAPACSQLSCRAEYTDSVVTMFAVEQLNTHATYLNVYSFEPDYAWKKVTAIKMPSGAYSVVVETTCAASQLIAPERLCKEVKHNLIHDLKLFDADDVLHEDTRRMEATYPVFCVDTLAHIEAVKDALESDLGVVFVGRQASFKYYSAHLAVTSTERIIAERFA